MRGLTPAEAEDIARTINDLLEDMEELRAIIVERAELYDTSLVGQRTHIAGARVMLLNFLSAARDGDLKGTREESLEYAVSALQHIKANSRCHMSRVVATNGLKTVGATGELPTDPDGMPERVQPKGEMAERQRAIEDFYLRH